MHNVSVIVLAVSQKVVDQQSLLLPLIEQPKTLETLNANQLLDTEVTLTLDLR